MRRFAIICVLVVAFTLIKAEQEAAAQKPEVTKLGVVNLGEIEIDPVTEQHDVQQKRDSRHVYNRLNRVLPGLRSRFRANRSRGQVASRIPAQLNTRPFAQYGPPSHSHSHSSPIAHGHHHPHQHRGKLQQHHVGQQQPQQSIDDGLMPQEVPSPIRNADFAIASPIASQNNEPFGMHTANYLPPWNQKLPVYPSTEDFTPQLQSPLNLHSQNLEESQNHHHHHQLSDAALFLSENAQAIQQLYGAPASNQNFAPGNEQFQTGVGDQVPHDQFGDFESTLHSPQEPFVGALPSYASGTLSPQETLEQIQSLEKDRLIAQLQQALAQAQISPKGAQEGRYAQNQADLIQSQELLASVNQEMSSRHVPATPQSFRFAAESAALSQSPFLPGTTINPLDQFPLNYGVATTARTIPTTTTGTTTIITRPTEAAGLPFPQIPQSPEADGTSQVTSSQPVPNQPGPPVGLPTVYGGFVPTIITGTNLIPNYDTGVFTAVRPARPASGTSPTHFGIPIPAETIPGKPGGSDSPLIPGTTTTVTRTPFSFKPFVPANQPGLALTPAITPVALPIQPIRPVAAPHPFAGHPVISNPLQPVLPQPDSAQVHPIHASDAGPAVTSGVQHAYGVQTALVNPVVYKPVKTVYPLYYYPNVAYQLQKPLLLPGYPWSYAPSYAQTKPAQAWK